MARRRLPACLAALLSAALGLPAPAAAAQPLDDAQLAAVQGRDGLAFNLVGLSLSGPLTLTYTAPGGASLALSGLALSRSDDPAATFSDPYRLGVRTRSDGLADLIVLNGPANAAGRLKWQFAADWRVQADGITHEGGALRIDDAVFRNTSLALTTPAASGVEGAVLGLGLQLEIRRLALRPRGRADAGEELSFGGLRLGAAAADGTPLGTPWRLADATLQPAIFNAVTDAQGVSAIRLGIDWPTSAAGAPTGSLVIDNIAFRSNGATALDLGASRIGTLQIQYADIRLRAGP